MTRMYSHMEDIYFEMAEVIDNDLIAAILFVLLFGLFISYAQLTVFELGIFYVLYRVLLRCFKEYKNYEKNLKSYEASLNDFGDVSCDELDSCYEEDDENQTFDLLNFELKELKMKKKD